MNERDEKRRAEDASRLLNDPLLKEAFERVEKALLSGMQTVDVTATEAQRGLIVSYQLLSKVRQYLEQVMVTGQLIELEEQRKVRARRV